MTHLPPPPSAYPATRASAGSKSESMGSKAIDRLDDRCDRLEDRFTGEIREMHGVLRDQLRASTLTTIGSITALSEVLAALVTIVS